MSKAARAVGEISDHSASTTPTGDTSPTNRGSGPIAWSSSVLPALSHRRGAPEGATYGRICRFCVELGLTTRHGGRVVFRDVLDALIQANYKRNQVEVVAEVDADAGEGGGGADVPPAVRAVLEVKRRQSLNAGLVTSAFADANERDKMAMFFADGLFSRFVRARRERQRRRSLEQAHM